MRIDSAVGATPPPVTLPAEPAGEPTGGDTGVATGATRPRKGQRPGTFAELVARLSPPTGRASPDAPLASERARWAASPAAVVPRLLAAATTRSAEPASEGQAADADTGLAMATASPAAAASLEPPRAREPQSSPDRRRKAEAEADPAQHSGSVREAASAAAAPVATSLDAASLAPATPPGPPLGPAAARHAQLPAEGTAPARPPILANVALVAASMETHRPPPADRPALAEPRSPAAPERLRGPEPRFADAQGEAAGKPAPVESASPRARSQAASDTPDPARSRTAAASAAPGAGGLDQAGSMPQWPCDQIADAVEAALGTVVASPSGSSPQELSAQAGAAARLVRVLNIALAPAELGTVTVRLSLEDSALSLRLATALPATAGELAAGRSELVGRLARSGYEVSDVSVIVEAVMLPAVMSHGQEPAAPSSASRHGSGEAAFGGQPGRDGQHGGAGRQRGEREAPAGRQGAAPSRPQGFYI